MSRLGLRSLSVKLVLAFLLVSLTGVALAALLARQSTSQAFNSYLLDQLRASFSADVTQYYQANGSLNGINDYFHSNETLAGRLGSGGRAPGSADRTGLNTSDPRARGEGGPGGAGPALFVLADPQGEVLVAGGRYHTGERLSAADLAASTAVEVDGQAIGRMLSLAGAPRIDPREQLYIERIDLALALSAVAGALIALLLGWVLARNLGRPLRELTAAIRAMAGGNLRQRVPVRSQDELGQLSQAFNQMSADLEQANQLRRQMTADIAHELRTPLTVISGYLESLRDGVLPPSQERLDTLYEQSQHLARLVEDLRTLSLADAGELSLHPRPAAPRDLLERLAGVYQARAAEQGVALAVEAGPDLPEVSVDLDRIQQVLSNLVSNALRYTPAGGGITLSARAEAGQGVALEVRDTGAGIDPADLPRVFERFYRADKTRSTLPERRAPGGVEESRGAGEGESGLGLAIARSIVELHGGQIRAFSPGPGQGSAFTILLPAISGEEKP